MARLFSVPVCVPSSADLTAGASPSLASVWLSKEQLEDVDDMRDFASRPSRTCRKSPLAMASSFLLCPWAEMEHVVSPAWLRCHASLYFQLLYLAVVT